MPKARSKKSNKRSFHGNRYTNTQNSNDCVNTVSASELKLKQSFTNVEDDSKGHRLIDLSTLIAVFSALCCPLCLHNDMHLFEDSRFGLYSNFCLTCKCGFRKAFTSTPTSSRGCNINTLLVLGLRLIGKGFTAGRKLLFTLKLPFVTKMTFRRHERKLLEAVRVTSEENMKEAAQDVQNLKQSDCCGVSVDGTWQRRGHTSLNGCVSVISADTGKIIDLEVLSQHCRVCSSKKRDTDHICANHTGTSGSMEVVGAYRIFSRSVVARNLKYTEYYGDGDSKAYQEVKDTYGDNSVVKYECIGHVQKRVGSRLRKLKKIRKGLAGKGKLTDKFIDRLQNYYGIAIRSNVGNLAQMQSAVIAAFFHCCSSSKKKIHGQCPTGKESWCKFQRCLSAGIPYSCNSAGLPESIINIIKPTYMDLCKQELLTKCLHGKTQNTNESFHNVLWSVIPKETFVGYETLRLGANIAVLIFNSGYIGLIPVFKMLNLPTDGNVIKQYVNLDIERISQSKRCSLSTVKLARKRKRAIKKSKLVKHEAEQGVNYKCGEF